MNIPKRDAEKLFAGTASPEEAKFDYIRSYLPGATDPYNPDAKNGDIAHSLFVTGFNLYYN